MFVISLVGGKKDEPRKKVHKIHSENTNFLKSSLIPRLCIVKQPQLKFQDIKL